jgi:hypothetical protein
MGSTTGVVTVCSFLGSLLGSDFSPFFTVDCAKSAAETSVNPRVKILNFRTILLKN